MLRLTFIWIYITSVNFLFGQSAMTLQDCIQRAEEVAIDLQRAELNISRLDLEAESIAAAGLPVLGFNARSGLQNGRSIDPTTNAFSDQQLLFSTYNMQAEWLIYRGGRIKQEALRFNDLQLAQAAELAVSKRQLRLEVIFSYLSVQQSHSTLELNKQNLENIRSQLAQLEQLIDGGVKRPNDRLELDLRLNAGVRDSILAENDHNRQLNQLRSLLQWPHDQDLLLVEMDNTELYPALNRSISSGALLAELEQSDPGLKAAEARLRAADRQEEVVKADRRPELSLFAILATNHSSTAQRIEGVVNAMATQQVFLGGQATTLEVAQQLPVFGADPYFNQLRNNFSQTVGVNLRFNILDAGRNRRDRQSAQLEQREAQLAQSQYRLELQDQLLRQIAELEDARTNYFASEQQIENLQASLQAAEQSYDAGGLSTFDLVRVQAALDEAKLQANLALYDCIFRYELIMTLLEN